MAKVLERSLYQSDYYAWTKQQAAELRAMAAAGVTSTLDLEHLAEEVESLGRGDFASARSQLRRIIEHLLKLEHSPAADPRLGWRESVIEARDVFADVITATLRREIEADLVKTYHQGRRRGCTGNSPRCASFWTSAAWSPRMTAALTASAALGCWAWSTVGSCSWSAPSAAACAV